MADTTVMAEDSSEIVWIFQAVRKHLALIALVVIAMTLLATGFVVWRTKQYTADAVRGRVSRRKVQSK